MSDEHLRRIERAEDHVSELERNVAGLITEFNLFREEYRSRIKELKLDVNANFKREIDSMAKHVSQSEKYLKEHTEELRKELSDDITQITSSVGDVNEDMSDIAAAIQKLHVTQSTADIKVSTNERIIWAVIGVVVTASLYFLQSYLTSSGLSGGPP